MNPVLRLAHVRQALSEFGFLLTLVDWRWPLFSPRLFDWERHG